MTYSIAIGDKTAEVIFSDTFGVDQLGLVKEMLTKALDTRIEELKKAEGNRLSLSADIDSMYPELTGRTRNVLKRNGCNTIEDVLDCTPTDLKRMRNMGKRSLDEIRERFEKYGAFKEDVPKGDSDDLER